MILEKEEESFIGVMETDAKESLKVGKEKGKA